MRAVAADAGSSPLTRGKRERAALNGDRERLIPAHAGKTGCLRGPRFLEEAHPRSRGENVAAASRPNEVPGSSPLTRGKLRAILRRLLSDGLIPAHAGKTPRS